MSWLKIVWHELVGIFIDDGWFALAIVVWLVLLGGLLPHVPVRPIWQAVLLFGGLAAILTESVLRRARRR